MKFEFLFATCQVGAETALKKEIARDYPNLRFAFSRAGFLTFKWLGDPEKFNLDLPFSAVFARSWGLSIQKFRGGAPENAAAILAACAELHAALRAKGKLRLHIWERDQYQPEAEPKDFTYGRWAEMARAEIQKVGKGKIFSEAKALSGELVFDIVAVDEQEWWLGLHRQTPERSPYPGGMPQLSMPSASPSRAYLKLEEAILFSQAPLQQGDHAFEVGSAPGGASYALLKRGLKVIGVDPGKMSPIVLTHKNFQHLALPINSLRRDQIPEGIQWLLVDMNMPPKTLLSAVKKVAPLAEGSLLGFLLTVKLNSWRVADDIPKILKRLREYGAEEIRATQLPSNRQEIFVYGLTAAGLSRIKRS